MTRSPDRRALAAARAVTAGRAGTATTGDIRYAIYLAVLTAAIVVVPGLRAIVLGLAEPEILTAMIDPAGYRVVAVIGAVLAAAVLLVGPVRGPVVPGPFVTEFLAGSGLARGIALRRPFLIAAAVLAGVAVTVTGLLLGARLPSGVVSGAGLASALVGTVGYSTLIMVLWLIGQAGARRLTVPIALGILICAVAAGAGVDALMLLTPWGWLALLWQPVGPSAAPVFWPVVPLLLLPLGLLAVPALLNALRGAELMAQSRRWQSIGTMVQTGDVAGAAGVLRGPPTSGRRVTTRLAGPLVVAVLRRDLLAARRFPVRSVLGSAGLVLGGWLTAVTPTLPDGLHWLTGSVGALVVFLAAGVCCDGLRNAAENAGPSSLYGRSDLAMIAAHALLPLVASVVLTAAGAGIAVAGGAPVAVLAWGASLAVLVVLVRVLDCAKGPMPIGLLLPVVTPVGDLSILNVIAWQADAVLLIAIAGGVLTALFTAAGPTAVPWLVLAGAAVAALALRRIRALAA